MLYFTILLALFAGIGDPFLALTLKKPKENQCFWLRTLKNLRKIYVFAFPRASGDPGGTIGPTTAKKLYITNSRSTAQAAVMLHVSTYTSVHQYICTCIHGRRVPPAAFAQSIAMFHRVEHPLLLHMPQAGRPLNCF